MSIIMKTIRERMKKILLKCMTQTVQIKIIAVLTIVIFICLLLPLLAISGYSVKQADDFSRYGDLEAVWQQTHSLWAVLKGSVLQAVQFWKDWQGTYFYVAFCSAILGVCGDQFYFVTTFLTMGSMIAGEMILFHVVLKKTLGADKYCTVILSLSCILLQILLMPAPAQGFFWLNGGILYMFAHGAAMILMALCICLWRDEGKNGKKVWYMEAAIILLSFMTGGSNYVTGLTTAIFYTFLILMAWVHKRVHRRLLLADGVLYLFCFLLNLCAPGNGNRLAVIGDAGMTGYSPIKSIIASFQEAAAYMCSWSILPFILGGILLLPFMIRIAKETKYKFRYPVIASIFAFCVYAAQFTPTLYTQGFIGEGRIQNIYRMAMVIWLYGNELYWVGHYVKRCEYSGQCNKTEEMTSYLLPGWCFGILCICFSMSIWGGTTVTSYSAWKALRTGEARQFKQAYDERIELLKNSREKEVYVDPFPVAPYLLYINDIGKDTEGEINRWVAVRFNKEKVGIKVDEKNIDYGVE